MEETLQYTYVIYTVEEGVFYVGIGNERRLQGTLVPPKKWRYSVPSGKAPKFIEIERRQKAGQTIVVEPVFSSYIRVEVEQCERDLIRCYGKALTNVIYKDSSRSAGWIPPGMQRQAFPIKDCQECQKLWQKVQLTKGSFSESFSEKEKQSYQRAMQRRWRLYHRHTDAHPQFISK